jgi:hypothetical protein
MQPRETMPNVFRLALCLCLFSFTWTSRAEASVPPSISGVFGGQFRLSDPKEAGADINKAVNKVVNRLFSLKRTTARKRLAPITNPCATFKMDFPGDQIQFECGKLNILSPASGQAVNVVLPSGESVSVQQRIQDGNLVQLFKGTSGTRFNEIKPRPGGGLELHVEIQSKQLPERIQYKLDFAPVLQKQARRD